MLTYAGYENERIVKRDPVILVVDDERPICDLLGDLLEEEGYRVNRAYDGLAALAAAERERPDLILSDVTMPRLDGVSLVRRLRDRGVRAPAVLMSAVKADVDLPYVRFVPKPFDVDDILGVVDRLTRTTGRVANRGALGRFRHPHLRTRRRRRAQRGSRPA
ncbi:MAG TPA: response regulator [Thermomicrobiales bacterium]|jgi:DNA-binding response OmpR family regulator